MPRDVRCQKFVGTGMERNAFLVKKIFLFPVFFLFSLPLNGSFHSFLSFLVLVIPFFAILFQFPVFPSFHLSKAVLSFSRGLNLAILERVLNENFSKPVLHYSTCYSSRFQKSFFVLIQPVFLIN